MLLVRKIILILLCTGWSVATDNNRIVGGRPAEDGEFPFQVSIRRSYNDKHFCGGSLISPTHILTAAHCMFYVWGGILPPIVVTVVAGQLNLTITSDTIYRNISKITIHPEYDKKRMTNDVAILEVEVPFPVKTNLKIAPVALRSNPVEKEACIVSGWGVESFQSKNISEILLAAEVNIIENSKCDKMYGYDVISSSMLCAGVDNGERDACQGDSGGPLLCNGVLTGIVSTGNGCANSNFPGIYANVPNLLSWILQHSNASFEASSISENATFGLGNSISNYTESIANYNPEFNPILQFLGPDKILNNSSLKIKLNLFLFYGYYVFKMFSYLF